MISHMQPTRKNRNRTDMDTQAEQHPENKSAAISLKIPSRRRGLYRDAVYRFTRNKLAVFGFILVIILLFMAIFADDWFIALPMGREPQPLLAKTHYDEAFYGPVSVFPSREYWMGTDLIGRDMWSRIVYGTRVSLSVAFLAQLVAIGIGIPLGALAGWRGGISDFMVMRLVDIMSALPALLFAFLIMARLGAGFWSVMLAIGLSSWIIVARLTRAQFLSLREKEFVEAARSVGATDTHIIRAHLLPNSLAPLVVAVTLGIPAAIFAEAALSFLGVGINPPMPSWGQMLSRDGLPNITLYWHLALFPALMIALTMLGFTLMGDGLQDALNPQKLGGK
jgi:ABC-type dipeptide/oligopeptide/nickel transport system permease subunit